MLGRHEVVDREELVGENHEQQHGDGAEELHDHAAHPADGAVLAQASQTEDHAKDDGQQNGATAEKIVPLRPGSRYVVHVCELRNGVHSSGAELVALVQLHKHPREDRGGDDGGDDCIDGVVASALGAGAS